MLAKFYLENRSKSKSKSKSPEKKSAERKQEVEGLKNKIEELKTDLQNCLGREKVADEKIDKMAMKMAKEVVNEVVKEVKVLQVPRKRSSSPPVPQQPGPLLKVMYDVQNMQKRAPSLRKY
jgi:hypothetical protein